MSASLVGSEMCIRDRCSPAPQRHLAGALVGLGRGREVFQAEEGPRPHVGGEAAALGAGLPLRAGRGGQAREGHLGHARLPDDDARAAGDPL
eukprot:373037-Alexandrium_andersonii.AAC.1